MAKIKCSLDTYNALTDTNPDHFSLFVDDTAGNEYILIKEKVRGTSSVSSLTNIAHSLSYVPMCIVFAEISSGVWRKLFSSPIDGVGLWYEINGTYLILRNTSGSAKNFSYYIFYDNLT